MYTLLVNTHAYPPLLSWPIFVRRVIISPWFFPSSLFVQRTGHCCTRGYRVIRIETYFSFFHLLQGSPFYSERVITKFMDNLLSAVFSTGKLSRTNERSRGLQNHRLRSVSFRNTISLTPSQRHVGLKQILKLQRFYHFIFDTQQNKYSPWNIVFYVSR